MNQVRRTRWSPRFCTLRMNVKLAKRNRKLTLTFLFLLVFIERSPCLPLVNAIDHRHDKQRPNDSLFWIGTAIHDITGPAAQVNLMGYAKASQTAHGIHQRLWARAFVISKGEIDPTEDEMQAVERGYPELKIGDQASMVQRFLTLWTRGFFHPEASPEATFNLDPTKTICFVSIDAGMGSDLLNQRVLRRLKELLDSDHLLCQLENLSISGTHTHSAPAGFLQYLIFQFTSMGFIGQVMDHYVEGVAQALVKAHKNVQKANVKLAQDMLFDASINRSPSSYLLNPHIERQEYEEQGNTDKTMLQLSFTASYTGQSLGVLNWFAVHGTSMNSTNQLLSGDNKGYASYLMEKRYNPTGSKPGDGEFVAAFASTNLGDVSPNTAGARCLDTGDECDFVTSTCNGQMKLCVASGPGEDMFESTKIIGEKQYDMAVRLNEEFSPVTVAGDVAFRHSFVDMSTVNVTLANGTVVSTCLPALGYSFAAGTTDGAGDFDFHQGTNSTNPFWNAVGGFMSSPSKAQEECHSPKPILLNAGAISRPYAWEPRVVPISIFRVGDVFILNVPAEFTTMAGRRLRKAVRQVLVSHGIKKPIVTISGLSNSYSHYVTTFEEYQGQRYEAASTIFGPHTLEAYLQEFRRITWDLLLDSPSTSASEPPDLSHKQISLLPPVEFDTIGLGRSYGSVAVDAKPVYTKNQTAFVSFRSANPRNNPRTGGTFLSVETLDDHGDWKSIYVDADWCTKFYWRGGVGYFGESFAEILWDIPESTPQGLYRICHYGTRKTLLGSFEAFVLRSYHWLATTVVGTPSLFMPMFLIDFATRILCQVRDMVQTLDRVKMRDFEGCSQTFMVANG